MKYIVIICFLVVLGIHSLFGQSISEINALQSDKKQTISLSYSPIDINMIRYSLSYNKFDVVLGEFGVKGVVYKPHTSGIFTVGYSRAIKERITVTLNLSYQQIWRKWDLYVDVNSPHYYTERFHVFQVLPEVRYDYVKRKAVALFLSTGIGVNYFYNTRGAYGDVIASYKRAILGYQIWFLGLEVNPVENLVLCMKSVGFGTIGFFEFGLGYRF